MREGRPRSGSKIVLVINYGSPAAPVILSPDEEQCRVVCRLPFNNCLQMCRLTCLTSTINIPPGPSSLASVSSHCKFATLEEPSVKREGRSFCSSGSALLTMPFIQGLANISSELVHLWTNSSKSAGSWAFVESLTNFISDYCYNYAL